MRLRPSGVCCLPRCRNFSGRVGRPGAGLHSSLPPPPTYQITACVQRGAMSALGGQAQQEGLPQPQWGLPGVSSELALKGSQGCVSPSNGAAPWCALMVWPSRPRHVRLPEQTPPFSRGPGGRLGKELSRPSAGPGSPSQGPPKPHCGLSKTRLALFYGFFKWV